MTAKGQWSKVMLRFVWLLADACVRERFSALGMPSPEWFRQVRASRGSVGVGRSMSFDFDPMHARQLSGILKQHAPHILSQLSDDEHGGMQLHMEDLALLFLTVLHTRVSWPASAGNVMHRNAWSKLLQQPCSVAIAASSGTLCVWRWSRWLKSQS